VRLLLVLVVAGPGMVGVGAGAGSLPIQGGVTPHTAVDAGSTSSTVGDPVSVDGGDLGAAQVTPPLNDTANESTTNASVPRHENPETADANGDLEDLQRWLSGRMGEVFVDCSQRVQVGSDYVCDRLDEEYPAWASRFVDLAQETGGSGDDNASRVVNETARSQREFAERVREFRETHEAYQEAKQAGEERRARRLARDLRRQGDRVDRSGGRLVRDFEILGGNTSMELDPAVVATTNVTENVTETAETVQTAEFTPTALTLRANPSTASFDEPTVLSGRLETDEGEALANRTVVVRAPDRRLATRTDDDGAFAVAYRPTTAPTGPVSLTASYRPEPTSLFAVSNASTTVTVAATTATVELGAVPNRTGFGTPVAVSGRVRAGDRVVPSVPLSISLGGVVLGEVSTDDRGRFTFDGALPATVPAGDRRLVVGVARNGTAITASPAAATVTVESTPTTLSAAGTRVDANAARVSGRLTAAGRAVPDGRLVVRRDAETLGVVRTDADGRFEATLSLPEVPANRSTNLSVTYDPLGGNLAPAETEVAVPATESSTTASASTGAGSTGGGGSLSDVVDSLVSPEFAALLVAVLLVAGAVALTIVDPTRVRSIRATLAAWNGLPGDATASDADASARPDDGGADAEAASGDEVAPQDAPSPLSAARERLAAGRPDEAIIVAYGVARNHLSTELGRDPTLTHWELFADYTGSLDERRRDALQRLTEAYERAAFSPAAETADFAGHALEQAGIVLGENGDSTGDSDPADD